MNDKANRTINQLLFSFYHGGFMTTIELQGELGINNATEVKKLLISAAEKKQPITFDVSKLEDIDVIACTYGPGLVGALLVGVSYAKALAFAANKPLIGTNHIEGHIAANYITHQDLKPPFVAFSKNRTGLLSTSSCFTICCSSSNKCKIFKVNFE